MPLKERGPEAFVLRPEAEREKLLKFHARMAKKTAHEEREASDIWKVYDFYDSSLGSFEEGYGSLIPGYDRKLIEADAEKLLGTGQLLPRREFLKTYIESELSSLKGRTVVVELGGPGSWWSEEFSKDFLKQSFGLTLEDKRTEEQKEDDALRNHTVIAGDMFQGNSLEQLEKQVGPKGVHVVFERLAGYGTPHIPSEPVFIGKYLQRVYRLLADRGIMFVQLPLDIQTVFATYAWLTKLHRDHPNTLQVAISNFAFRFERFPGAPDELSLLSAKEFKHVEKMFQEGLSLPQLLERLREMFERDE